LLRLPTAVSPWDWETYPETGFIIMPIADQEQAARDLLEAIPQGQALLFKFIDAPCKKVILESFSANFARSFTSFTISNADHLPHYDKVVIAHQLEDGCRDLYLKNGHDPASLEKVFRQDGAASFTIYQNQQPLSTCYVYPNTPTIWEIAGVHTVEAERGKGYARQVVSEAIHWLLEDGLIPRYHVEDSNLPSVRLAESLGLKRCLQIEHYLTL
jgi:GNAT superfamily N-acetyltransferase